MPLTKIGRKVKSDFQREYGKKEGTTYFYQTMHQHPEWHLPSKSKKGWKGEGLRHSKAKR